MEHLLKILSVILLSSFKFLLGIGLSMGSGFNQFEIIIFCVGGGMLGVFYTLYARDAILKIYHKYYPRKPKPVKFSKFKRRLVVFIRKYEVWGIAIITPIITIPIGAVLAAAIEHNKWRIKFIMFCSLSFWTLMILGIKLLLKVDFLKIIESTFPFFNPLLF